MQLAQAGQGEVLQGGPGQLVAQAAHIDDGVQLAAAGQLGFVVELRSTLGPLVERPLLGLLLLDGRWVEGGVGVAAQGAVVIVRAVTRQQGHRYWSAHIPELKLAPAHLDLQRENTESRLRQFQAAPVS